MKRGLRLVETEKGDFQRITISKIAVCPYGISFWREQRVVDFDWPRLIWVCATSQPLFYSDPQNYRWKSSEFSAMFADRKK